jgi:hypothetical protein
MAGASSGPWIPVTAMAPPMRIVSSSPEFDPPLSRRHPTADVAIATTSRTAIKTKSFLFMLHFPPKFCGASNNLNVYTDN